MKQTEIKEAIANYELKRQTIDDVTTFVLNPQIMEINKGIHDLRLKCAELGHKYEDGKCIYCGEKE